MTLADRIVVMHGGHIQQQGTPEELFKKPANKFVAGFLGTPPMNFINVTATRSGDDVFLRGKGFELLCDNQTIERLDQSNSQELLMGIRPCDLNYNPNATTGSAIDIDVVLSEYIGAQSVLIGDCGGQEVMVELKSDTPIALGERLRFSINLNDLHFFNLNDDNAIG